VKHLRRWLEAGGGEVRGDLCPQTVISIHCQSSCYRAADI
jgi:hypothetical protein